MLSLKTTSMDANYPPDTHLSGLGYSFRCYLSQYVNNTFLRMFGLSHLNLFLTRSGTMEPSSLLRTLEQSDVLESVHHIRQLAQWIVEGSIAIETLEKDWEYYLLPYLQVGGFLGVCDSEEVLGEKEAMERFCTAFQTHLVVLEHTEKTLKSHLFLVEGEALVIHMETFQGHFCSLIHQSRQGFPLTASKDQLYEHYSAYIESQDKYMALIFSQRNVIHGLLAVLKKEIAAEQLSALFQKSEAQARVLGLDSEAYSRLGTDFAAYFSQNEAENKPRGSNLPPNLAAVKVGLLSPGHSTVSKGLAFPPAQKPLFAQEPATPGTRTVPEKKPPSQRPLPVAISSPKDIQVPAEPAKAGPAEASSCVKSASPAVLKMGPIRTNVAGVPSPQKSKPAQPIVTDRPQFTAETSSMKCWKCHNSDYELYSDGKCASCRICFKCAWKNAGTCPKCHRQYEDHEISRFRLIMS